MENQASCHNQTNSCNLQTKKLNFGGRFFWELTMKRRLKMIRRYLMHPIPQPCILFHFWGIPAARCKVCHRLDCLRSPLCGYGDSVWASTILEGEGSFTFGCRAYSSLPCSLSRGKSAFLVVFACRTDLNWERKVYPNAPIIGKCFDICCHGDGDFDRD